MLQAKNAHVLRDHQPEDDLPLTLSPGDIVHVQRPHPQRPGLVWAHDGSICAGWVPVEVLEAPAGTTRATAEYCSQEIAVTQGDTVRLLWQGAGGWWCENRDGDRGWLPADILDVGSSHSDPGSSHA
jgi:hypothetical protein